MGTLLKTRRNDDRGGIVVGWLTRLTLVLGLLGLVAFEVLSIAVAHVQVKDIGQSAAQEAITTFQTNGNPALAYESARSYADEHGANIKQKTFVITADSVSFVLDKTAPTLLLHRVGPLAEYAEVSTKVYAQPIETSGQLQ